MYHIVQARPAQSEPEESPLERNPFFIPYETTDLKFWQKKQTDQVKKKLFKKQILKKSVLKHVHVMKLSKDSDWLKLSLQEIGAQCTWVQPLKKFKQFEPESLYDMKDLIDACDNVKNSLPTVMSEMAKMMYS